MNKVDNNQNNSNLFLIDKDNNKFELDKIFIEWLVGFTDAEGNFSITFRDNPALRNINVLKPDEKVSKFINLTFQIGLHITNLGTLEIIKKN